MFFVIQESLTFDQFSKFSSTLKFARFTASLLVENLFYFVSCHVADWERSEQ